MADAMRTDELAEIYRAYIDCLNAQDWSNLGRFVHDEARRNGELLGVAGYQAMLERDHAEIPDLHFQIERLLAQPPHLASRLRFDCTPRGRFLGLDVNGRRVSFCENVFYTFRDRKIVEVLSIVDKAAIELQLQTGTG